MSDTVRVALVGINGYGGSYLRHFKENRVPAHARLVGAIDTNLESCQELDYLADQQVGTYHSLEDFFAEQSADLVVISSPIHWHCAHSILALENGAHVLCEKPVCATIQEARKMLAAEAATGRFIGIGYQWSFATPIQQLKSDIRAGLLGAPKRLRTMVCWPRRQSYYQRNGWAGALKSADGRWVLDSPVNNATAHYLHNMFYILGKDVAISAELKSVTGELYRANPIANYDTATLRCLTEDDVEILFMASHAVADTVGPIASYEFEQATVTIDVGDNESKLVATFRDGTQKVYGNPNAEQANKLVQSIAAVRGESLIACGVEAAAAQTLCMNGLQDSVDAIVTVPDSVIAVEGEDEDPLTYITGMNQHLLDCYEKGCLLSELGQLDWARPGHPVDLRNYQGYPGGGTPLSTAQG